MYENAVISPQAQFGLMGLTLNVDVSPNPDKGREYTYPQSTNQCCGGGGGRWWWVARYQSHILETGHYLRGGDGGGGGGYNMGK